MHYQHVPSSSHFSIVLAFMFEFARNSPSPFWAGGWGAPARPYYVK